jgi:hypothetical protein
MQQNSPPKLPRPISTKPRKSIQQRKQQVRQELLTLVRQARIPEREARLLIRELLRRP